MPKFLTTTGVSHEIENIIKGAKNKLALVSPYLKLSQNFYERLRDADKKSVAILIVYGKEELTLEQKKQLPARAEAPASRSRPFGFYPIHKPLKIAKNAPPIKNKGNSVLFSLVK